MTDCKDLIPSTYNITSVGKDFLLHHYNSLKIARIIFVSYQGFELSVSVLVLASQFIISVWQVLANISGFELEVTVVAIKYL